MSEPSPTEPNSETSEKPTAPWWVRFALWGHLSRTSLAATLWVCLLVGLACILAGLTLRRLYGVPGVIMLLGAGWHARALAWCDRNRRWDR